MFGVSIAKAYCDAKGHFIGVNSRHDTVDYALLDRIVEKKPGDQDIAIVHLRLGDVLENNSTTVEEFLEGQHFDPRAPNIGFVGVKGSYNGNVSFGYVKPLSYYEAVVNILPLHVRRIVLIGGSHKVLDMSKSLQYVEAIQTFFKNRGYDVMTRITTNPSWQAADEDFTFLSNAAHYVPGGGGYSYMAGKLVEYRGGRVYRPDDRLWRQNVSLSAK